MTRTPLYRLNHWFLPTLTTCLAYGLLAMDHAAAQSPANSQPRWTADEQLVNELSEKRPQINYDEAKVPDYTLPDSLKLQNGADVVDAATWNDVRRKELMSLFRNH